MRPRAIPTPVQGTFTGRHMFLVMCGFFGIIIAVNLVMAIAASVTWSGLVVQNSYVASQEFQNKHDALERQKALGWAASFSYAPGRARFTLRDGAGDPVDLGPITLQISRPVGTEDDQAVRLERAPDGGYVAMLDLRKGVWDALIATDTTAQGPFEFRERFTVEADQP
ncbi:MAG: FixH family protein [Devosia sp.]